MNQLLQFFNLFHIFEHDLKSCGNEKNILSFSFPFGDDCLFLRMKSLDNSTVASFDLSRFMGRWYEIARYEHRFEKGMTHVTATYTLRDNGTVSVKNEGLKNGKHKEIEGRAKQPDPKDPGKLKVSFFLWFYSDYYVLDVDPDYRYVLIGSSSDKYLWIMSREKTLPAEKQEELLDKLRTRGYDISKLLFVAQE